MQFGKVEISSVNTAQLKTLTDEETNALLLASKNGDPKARDLLIRGNLRLVLSVVQRFSNRNENPDDLFQVGCIGLIKAVDNFDVGLGLKLSTYAVPMIIGEVKRYLRDYTPVRVSRSLRDVAYHAMIAKEELTKKLDRDPTEDEIADRIGEPRKKVVLAMEAVVDPLSLYEPVFSDNTDALYLVDQLGSVEDENDWIDEISMKEALRNLAPREKSILQKRFFYGKTQVEVAKEIGISQAQVSRLEKNAMRKLIAE